MSTTFAPVSFRIPLELKKRATSTAKKSGIPLAVVVNRALSQFSERPELALTSNGFTTAYEQHLLSEEQVLKKNPRLIKKITLAKL